MSDLQCPEMVVLMWHKKFQDGFSNLKDDSHPGQPKVVLPMLILLHWQALLNETPELQ